VPGESVNSAGPAASTVPLRFCRPAPRHQRGARTRDHLRHVFGIASRTRPLGAASDRMRRDQPPTAYALVSDYFRW